MSATTLIPLCVPADVSAALDAFDADSPESEAAVRVACLRHGIDPVPVLDTERRSSGAGYFVVLGSERRPPLRVLMEKALS